MGCNQDHEHDAIQFSFYDEAEAVNWFRNQELDQYFIINDSKPNGYRMYKCNQSKCTMRKGYKYTTDKGSKKTEDCQVGFFPS